LYEYGRGEYSSSYAIALSRGWAALVSEALAEPVVDIDIVEETLLIEPLLMEALEPDAVVAAGAAPPTAPPVPIEPELIGERDSVPSTMLPGIE